MEVLIVDDEQLAGRMLSRIVLKLHPQSNIHTFNKATEAMEYIETHLVDIVFLDIRMPVIDGLAFSKRLQELYPRVNVIFATGYNEYALDALNNYCSGYILKPVTENSVKEALDHLRYPIEEKQSNIYIHCFGMFEVYYHQMPIRFKYQRTKELLAYLVDRNGVDCTAAWMSAALFGDEEHTSYLKQLRKDLIDTFNELGEARIIRSSKNGLGINRELVHCDYFDYRDGKIKNKPEEYMEQYSFYN